ncbi:TIGR03758 family integrating conjugative element protein [Salmonella enterica]|uniref:TIGR03758 family integrating conjugative element protein n=2 Tax=Salmonella enterica I TaxID=59201 RepID=A0A5V0B8L3_SALEN|nr:TIGR03758 family integrating conjugative element protein [Salmonella enterica]EAB5862636.1 TIGR03758 family integrating conjugative element protein [Salmonella enterica subsp. enterica serovar Cairina]EAB6416884.1 TIGR03758 family integrating conjugative element protein [Salmonella enterica subsp. enterica]EBG0215173.1 TIGR03758 family integrating conjugative element protein [Salmonella enterica subsp. enterica serovar Louisiana]EBQ9461970.1 TIGR03758 family integrating conjugative element p
MNDAQTSAFKAASGNADPALLSNVFIGALIALLILWVGWGFVHVYRGYAAGHIKEQALVRFAIRSVLLIIIAIYLFAS